VEYLSRVLEHPAYEPGMSAIVDFSDVELGDFSAGAVRRLADFTRSLEDRLVGNRVAIVAPQPAVFGLARMYGLMRDPPYEVNVVRESSEAEAWLGRSDSDAPV
jgi:hypothetical protein